MSVYFTADSHFGHRRIIEYCNRPFKDVGHMNETIIANWNAKVKPSDTVYHLGDFAYGSAKYASTILSRLNGKIHFIKGNHDKAAYKIKDEFESFNPFGLEVSINGQSIVLCHYSMRTWNKSHWGSWQLYGHSHGSLPDDPKMLSFDVGVDCHNFFPISFKEVEAIMKSKTWKCPIKK